MKTDKNKEALIDQLKKTPIIQLACEKTSVARATFYRWKNEDPEFAAKAEEAITEGASLVNDVAESQLMSAIRERNLTAIIFWLKHHHKSYKTRIEVDAKLQTIQQELTPEQTEVVSRALRLAGLTTEDETDEAS